MHQAGFDPVTISSVEKSTIDCFRYVLNFYGRVLVMQKGMIMKIRFIGFVFAALDIASVQAGDSVVYNIEVDPNGWTHKLIP
ncbi:hypothetical protein DI392_14080 [Vibrio albus]|uniref:Uncharacterized protein n=1 Tax=Vibrio albus TaxID=2200953 RepID=A0A2U3B710_9VIBR|nr:hypothetical protein DI392_14080 [Vibrio albus]